MKYKACSGPDRRPSGGGVCVMPGSSRSVQWSQYMAKAEYPRQKRACLFLCPFLLVPPAQNDFPNSLDALPRAALVEETQDLAGDVLPSGGVVVHDAGGRGQDDVAELTGGEELRDPFLEIGDLDVVSGADDAALVEAETAMSAARGGLGQGEKGRRREKESLTVQSAEPRSCRFGGHLRPRTRRRSLA